MSDKLIDAQGLGLYANVERFDDRRLLGGDDWDAEVKAALDCADIVLLLVTANFIGSEYIHRVELPTALRRRASDGAIVVPVLLEPCARKLLQIDDVNYLPKDGQGVLKPIAEWGNKTAKARALTQVIEHLHAQIERQRERAERQAETAERSGIDIALYRERAHKKWSAVDLSALAAPGAVDADIAIRLSDVFVPQNARRSRPSVTLPHDWLEKQGIDAAAEMASAEQVATAWKRAAPVLALDLIAECRDRHLVLLGDPGAGKSALTRYVLLQLLDDAAQIAPALAPLAGHVPFLVELRDYVLREAEGRCTDLVTYLDFCGRGLGFGFDALTIEHQFATQPTLLIIDGLDEIFDEDAAG